MRPASRLYPAGGWLPRYVAPPPPPEDPPVEPGPLGHRAPLARRPLSALYPTGDYANAMVPEAPPVSGGPATPLAIDARAPVSRRPVSMGYPAGDPGPVLYEEGTEAPLLARAPSRSRPVSQLYPAGAPLPMHAPTAPGSGGDAFVIDGSGIWTVFGSMPMVRGKKWPATGTLTISGAAVIASGNDPSLVPSSPPAAASEPTGGFGFAAPAGSVAPRRRKKRGRDPQELAREVLRRNLRIIAGEDPGPDPLAALRAEGESDQVVEVEALVAQDPLAEQLSRQINEGPPAVDVAVEAQRLAAENAALRAQLRRQRAAFVLLLNG